MKRHKVLSHAGPSLSTKRGMSAIEARGYHHIFDEPDSDSVVLTWPRTIPLQEGDRGWKDMQVRFDEITNRASNLDAQLQSLDATQRAVKRAQESFEEITQRFERRMNEITEMQRLVEERFRQEWVGFKADDQKRWTNFTLAHDEQQREVGQSFEKITERLAVVEDSAQEVHDQLHILVDETQKRLQSQLAQVHNWVEEFDRTVGQSG